MLELAEVIVDVLYAVRFELVLPIESLRSVVNVRCME